MNSYIDSKDSQNKNRIYTLQKKVTQNDFEQLA